MLPYDDYIVFLLGSDRFEICNTIRDMADEFGIDTMYTRCIYLAIKFQKYDQRNVNTQSQYDSFCEFLVAYEKEIIDYLENDVRFDIKD